MPLAYQKGRLFVAKETGTYGTVSTATMLGAQYGPLSGLMTPTLGAQAGSPGCVMPTLNRALVPEYAKHISSPQIGRRYEDVAMVPGRQASGGDFTIEVMPDTIGLLLLLATGNDVVTPTGATTTTGAANTANATTLNVATGLPALTSGQYVYISDGANSEYVKVNGDQAINTLAMLINGGAGAAGGLKFTHAAGVTVQVGPWTHVFTPAATTPGTFQIEDNFGGHASSELYKGMILDQLDFQANISDPQAAVQAVAKVVGQAPSPTLVTASAGGSLPLEEVAIAAANDPTLTITGATSPTVYASDLKATIANNAKLAMAGTSQPTPYGAIGTKLSLRGSLDTIFEEYGAFQDYANNVIWSPAVFLYTWPTQLLPAGGTGLKQAATLQLSVQRFGLMKLGKESEKDGLVHLPIDEWRALDYSDFGSPFTWTLKNNVAVY